jgi:hypothetical protein
MVDQGAVLLQACSRQACSETWENIPRHKLAEQTIFQLRGAFPADTVNALVRG